MSERTTAELVADLRKPNTVSGVTHVSGNIKPIEYSYGPSRLHAEAADCLTRYVDVLRQAREAIRLTREYVDPHCYTNAPKLLPAMDGWSWYEAVVAIDLVLGDGPSAWIGVPDE